MHRKREKTSCLYVMVVGIALLASIPIAFSYGSFLETLYENQISVQGILTAIHSDYSDGFSEEIYYLETSGNKYLLRFPSKHDIDSGSSLSVSGTLRGTEIIVEDWRILKFPPPIKNLGEQRTVVILFNFLNDQSEPYTKEEVDSIVFSSSSSANNFYKEASFGQMWLSGKVVGWYTIPYDNSRCYLFDWADAADTAVLADGINVNEYDRKIYVFPYTASCNSGGYGDQGGKTPTRVWINGQSSKWLYAHELGHNFDLYHANSIDCKSKQIDAYSNCRIKYYGDLYDTMGSGYFHFSAPAKISLGWIPDPKVNEIRRRGIYTIESPLEISGDGVQALKIPKTDTNEFYYLEYRRPLGFDKNIPGTKITEGALIHIWNPVTKETTQLVDVTPETKKNASNAYYDESLADGATFHDETNKIRITQLSHNANSVTVWVEMPSAPCRLCGDPVFYNQDIMVP